MANIKACVRRQRKDGFWQVYIRVTHKRNVGFIKTDKMVSSKGLTKNNEIKDPFVLKYCADLVFRYNEVLNQKDISMWTVGQVIDFLTKEDDDICFSDYARKHIAKMFSNGQERNSRNYELAVNHLERFLGTTQVMFSQLTSTAVNLWIKSLETTHRAKEMYPVCVRQIFKAAIMEYNDYDNGLIRIKTNPWGKVTIPQSDRTTKRAISPEDVRKFFAAPLPESKMADPLPELGHDVAKLVLCLAGINTIDLYNMQKSDYHNGIISYKRAKTRKSRKDEAYIEMSVEPVIQPLIEKYKSAEDDPYLFNFHSRYSNPDSFNANVNHGIKNVCKSMGMAKEKWYSVYTFRHTWATVRRTIAERT